MMKNSYVLQLESKQGPSINDNNEVKPFKRTQGGEQKQRLAYTTSLRNREKELLSKIVWNNNHSFVKPTYVESHLINHRKLINLPDIKHSYEVREPSTYDIELLSKRENAGVTSVETDIRGTQPIVVVVSPPSSSVVDSDFVDESLPEEHQEKRKFVSLRGLPGSALGGVSSHPIFEIPHSRDFVSSHSLRDDISNQNDFKEENEFILTNPAEEDKQAVENPIFFEKLEEKMKAREVRELLSNRDSEMHSKDASTGPDSPSIKVQELRSVLKTPTPHNIRLTPHYPFETGIKNKRRMNRTSVHNGLLRGSRIQDHSHPSVVSSTQQLLCLTPSKGGVITLGSEHDIKEMAKDHEHSDGSTTIQVKRFNENETPVPLAATIVTKTTGGPRQGNSFFRIMQQGQSARPRTSAGHGNTFSMAQLHYKHTTQIRKPYRYPAISPTATGATRPTPATPRTPNYERNATAMSITKNPANTAYRIIESHVKWNRKWPVFHTQSDNVANVYPYQSSFMVQNSVNQARKMAPVLRVIPAFPNAPKAVPETKHPKSITETEGASQKKVRFTDQVGLPLVRNATPNYRRKHSYILRWLETAGRPIKTVPLV